MASTFVTGAGDQSHENTLVGTSEQPLCHIITPVGMLGYSFDTSLTYQALIHHTAKFPKTPIALILDSGSTDSGPAKLALGGMTCPRSAYEHDFRELLSLSHEFGAKILISSAGGDGTDAHVDEFLDIIQEIADEPGNESYDFKVLAVYSNISKSTVLKSMDSGSITGCGTSVPPITAADVNNAVTIVAQMGPEPFLAAMNAHPDYNIVIGGRAYDPAPYTAFSIFHAHQYSAKTTLSDLQIGGFTHMGKIMECGALCATPKSSSSMATVYLNGSFDITSLDHGSRCTPTSVAAHTLYEKSRPDLLAGPGGLLDLTSSRYEQLPDGVSVHVYGGKFLWLRDSGEPYTVKLEAAKLKGFRTICMGGIRDRILISQIDEVLIRVKKRVQSLNKDIQGDWDIGFHVYGPNGIMGSLEPGDSAYQPREIFLVGEALAPTQALANRIASVARVSLVHGSYPGQRGTGGNLAMGVGGKLEIEMGACAEFCLYHLMPVPAGAETAREITEGEEKIHQNEEGPLFSWRVRKIGKGKVSSNSKDISQVVGKENGKLPEGSTQNEQERPLVKSDLSSKRETRNPQHSASEQKPSKLTLSSSPTLAEIAPVIRSKNSGPYDITLDVVFSSLPIYNVIKKSDLLSKATISRLYHLDESQIIWCGFFDQALAFKATIPRLRDGKFVSSGSYLETDVHASQQYAGLLDLELGKELQEEILGLGISSI